MSNSLMYEFIKRMYQNGVYSEADIRFLGDNRRITAEEVQLILDSKAP